jgi:hypothetical protein
MKKGEEVTTFPGYVFAVRYYGAGFRDGHLNSGITLTGAELWWPGFLIRLRDGKYVVASVVDESNTALPKYGRELVDCDGRTPQRMVDEDIWPYMMGPKIESARPRAAAELLIDRGNPWVPRAKSCRFRDGDKVQTLPIGWAPATQETINTAAARTSAVLAPQPPARRIGGAVWVSIPSFYAPDEAAMDRLREQIKLAPQWRNAEAIVFDVRGNDGGNSAWGDQILEALYGRDYLQQLLEAKFKGQYVDWRVSPENLAHVKELANSVKRQQGDDSPSTKYFQSIATGMAAALAKGESLYRLPGGDETASNTPRATPLYKGDVILLTDRRCGSACLDFADRVRSLPNARQAGTATSADSVYMEIRSVMLPSGIARLSLPVKVYRNRPRGHNEWYEPQVEFPGDINDTVAVEKWLLSDVVR